MRLPRISVRTQVTTYLLMVTAAGFYYFTDWLVSDLRRFHLQSLEESLVDTANVLASSVSERMAQSNDLEAAVRPLGATFDRVAERRFSARIYDLEKTYVDLQVYVANTNGVIVFDSEGTREGQPYDQWLDVRRTLAGEYGARSTRTNPRDQSSSILHVAAPLLRDGEIVGVLTVRKPIGFATEFVRKARQQIVIVAWLAALTVAIGGAILTLLVTRPIRRLTTYVRAIRDGERATMPHLGHNEIGEMGAALEEMREALEGKEYVEEYVHTLTHEFKSPIAAIHGAAELMDEDMPPERRARFLSTIRSETQRMQQYVDQLLTLASLEKRQETVAREPMDLLAMLDELHMALEPRLQAKQLRLERRGDTDVTVPGELHLLRQAVDNLLQNAIEFSPQGGRIEVTVTAGGEGVTLEVTDQGPGIPDFALGRVTERFFSLPRPDSGMKSSGLGLALVQEVVALHGGRLDFAAGPESGTTVRVSLPAV